MDNPFICENHIKMKLYFTLFFSLLFVSLSFAQVSKDATISLTAVANAGTPSITLKWKLDSSGTYYAIYKKSRDASNWDSVTKVAKTAITYTDLAVTNGGQYEYMVIKRSTGTLGVSYVLAGINKTLPGNRGKIILLVDANYSTPLAADISQLQNDLRGDGWIVLRHDVNRSDAVTAVKQLIINDFNADQANVKSVYILGHVPVPYSGGFSLAQYYPPDGHPDHVGAWPCDLYYGTMNESIWTDNSFTDISGSRVQNHNQPGDGKFDIPYIYSDTVTLEVGRVDLFNMPAFSNNDTMLIKRYLAKAHNFKIGINVGAKKGYVSDNFGWMSGEAFASSGWRALTPMFGDSVLPIAGGSFFSTLQNNSSQFVYGCGGGSYTSCGGVGVTPDYAADSALYNFGMMFGSYFGDWDSQDNFLRAPLASKGWTLSNSWSGRPYHYYHQMALGENLGFCMRHTQNNYPTYVYNIYPTFVHVALMGDPSLRMNPVLPVSNIALSRSTDKLKVTVQWNKSKDAGVTSYAVYRSPSKTAPFVLSGTVPATDSILTENGPYNGLNYFMVRAIKPETTFSGTYMNMSIGQMDTISAINPVGIAANKKGGFSIYPNPAQNSINLNYEFGTNDDYTIRVMDINGRVLLTDAWINNTSEKQLDITHLTQGIYFISISKGMEMIHTEKFVKM
jgi:hypothetical protein